MTGIRPEAIFVSSASAVVRFDGVELLKSRLRAHYCYKITINATEQNRTKTKLCIQHNDTMAVTLENLGAAVTYNVQVTPFRKDIQNNKTEAGAPTEVITFTTGNRMGYRCVMLHLQ